MAYTVVQNGCRNCIICGATKPVSEFYRVKYTTKQGVASHRFEPRCKPCSRERRRDRYQKLGEYERRKQREYKRANRIRLNAAVKSFREANPDRIRSQRRASEAKRRASSGGANGAVVQRVLSEARVGDGYIDAYSGQIIQEPTIDHIVPLSAGGTHDYWNLCVTSKSNNSAKFNTPMIVWLAGQ